MPLLTGSHTLCVMLSMTEAVFKSIFVPTEISARYNQFFPKLGSVRKKCSFKLHLISRIHVLIRKELSEKKWYMIFYKTFYTQHKRTWENEECLLGKKCSRFTRKHLDFFRANVSDSRCKKIKQRGDYSIFFGNCEWNEWNEWKLETERSTSEWARKKSHGGGITTKIMLLKS